MRRSSEKYYVQRVTEVEQGGCVVRIVAGAKPQRERAYDENAIPANSDMEI